MGKVAIRLLRWMAVVPAGILGWYLALLVGLALLSGAKRLCPAESMVSGACMAPWFRPVEAAVFALSAALAATLVVLLPVVAAPGRRSAVAWVAFAVGLLVAVYFLVHTAAWREFGSAVAAGLLTVVGVVRGERGRAAKPRLAAPPS